MNQKTSEINFLNYTKKKLKTGHTSQVHGIAICQKRNLLVTGSGDSTVKLWNLENNTLIKTYKQSNYVLDVVLSNQGTLLAFGGGYDYSIKLVDISDINNNGIVTNLYSHRDQIYRIAFSNNSKYLISGSQDKTVRVWDVQSKLEIFHLNSNDYIYGVAISVDDNLIASTSDDTIKIWSFFKQKLLCSQNQNECGLGVQFQNDKQILASSHEQGIIKLWSLFQIYHGKLLLIRNIKAAIQSIWTAVFSSCSRFIISMCNEDREIKVIDQSTCEVVKLFKNQSIYMQMMIDVAISKDMKIIVYGEEENIFICRRQ